MNKQNKKRRAEGGGGELSPMVAAVALPGCSCCSAASSWSARAAARGWVSQGRGERNEGSFI